MKHLIFITMVVVASGCSTMGGAVSGAGQDLQKAGDWIKDKAR